MTVGYQTGNVAFEDRYVRYSDLGYGSGTLWAWGSNSSGILGLGTVTGYSSPVQVGLLPDWSDVKSTLAGHTLAIKTDGTLWAWGLGGSGELGQNSTVHRSSPVQVGAMTNWAFAVPGYQNSFAIKTDGTLWAWGRNDLGQLGLSDLIPRSSPVQVGAMTNWAKVDGEYFTAAIKTDGTLWTWGNNAYGQLGSGNIVSRSSPVQVGTQTDWKDLSVGYNRVAAIKTDGTLWTWGNNEAAYGLLGLSDAVHRSSPVQVGTQTDWKSVSCRYTHTLAIKANGTLWAWGANGNGMLGISTNGNSYSSPVQVGTLTNWKIAVASTYFSAAIKTDGTLWAWGRNDLGQLGLGDTTSRSSPTQVGVGTQWSKITSLAGNSSFAIKNNQGI